MLTFIAHLTVGYKRGLSRVGGAFELALLGFYRRSWRRGDGV